MRAVREETAQIKAAEEREKKAAALAAEQARAEREARGGGGKEEEEDNTQGAQRGRGRKQMARGRQKAGSRR